MTIPRIPIELWMFWIDDGGPDNKGSWALAIDGAVDVAMVVFNEKDAVSEAARQNELYDIECRPIRIR